MLNQWNSPRPTGRRRVLAALLALGLLAGAQAQITGDLNGDGRIDILDIQGATNMALGSAATTPQADADANTAVNVLDVQVLTNTALGTGGLVQPVVGSVSGAAKATGDIKVLAVSLDGRKVEATVNPQNGAFELLLPVRTSWSVSFKGGLGNTVTPLVYPLAGTTVWSLPLKSLSNGNVVNLGSLDLTAGIATSDDLRTLLAERSDPLETEDNDDDGWSDLFQTLILPYPWTVPGSGITLPNGLELSDLQDSLGDCIEDSLEDISVPDLTGVEGDGVPAFAVPVLACFRKELLDWLADNDDNNLSPAQITALTDQIMAVLTARIEPWVQNLDREELLDLDGNGVPDYIEDDLCHEYDDEGEGEGEGEDEGDDDKSSGPGGGGSGNNCELDDDSDGRPDYAQDDDNDDIPNYLDPDAYTTLDSDGDGIPNVTDLDDDNDGILDYADKRPLDPSED